MQQGTLCSRALCSCTLVCAPFPRRVWNDPRAVHCAQHRVCDQKPGWLQLQGLQQRLHARRRRRLQAGDSQAGFEAHWLAACGRIHTPGQRLILALPLPPCRSAKPSPTASPSHTRQSTARAPSAMPVRVCHLLYWALTADWTLLHGFPTDTLLRPLLCIALRRLWKLQPWISLRHKPSDQLQPLRRLQQALHQRQGVSVWRVQLPGRCARLLLVGLY